MVRILPTSISYIFPANLWVFSLHVNLFLVWENSFYPTVQGYYSSVILSTPDSPLRFCLSLLGFWDCISSLSSLLISRKPQKEVVYLVLSTHSSDWYTSRQRTLMKEWLRYLVKILRHENNCLSGRNGNGRCYAACNPSITSHRNPTQDFWSISPFSSTAAVKVGENPTLLYWRNPSPSPYSQFFWYLTFSLLWIKSACVHIFTVFDVSQRRTHTGVWRAWTSLCDWS